MAKMFCALGCSPTKNLFNFPSQKHDNKRRKIWLDFFDMEEPNISMIFACEKHFSPLQITSNGLKHDAVPDIPIICNAIGLPFKRKQKDWRKNVIVVTPRDPEFTIYRHETGVFPQNLFNNTDANQPVMQMPMIKSVSCSMSTQTNSRLCGLVQISDIKEEYRLNCFYCSEMFPIDKWSMFIKHLRDSHFEREQAFKMSKYLSQDHDYTTISAPNVEITTKSPIKVNMVNRPFVNLPSPPPIFQQVNIPPPLMAKPIQFIETPIPGRVFNISGITPPPLLPNPHSLNEKSFNITLADQVIKLLNETLLSPKFLQTIDDNILIIKNTGNDNIETSTFLKNLMNTDGDFVTPLSPKKRVQPKKSNEFTPTSKSTRPVYTISHGLQDIPSGRNTLPQLLFPPPPKNKMTRLIQKRMVQRTLKNIDVFESIYKAVKTRPPKVVEIVPDPKSVIDAEQPSKLTPLSRCLKRSITETTETNKFVPKKSTEIVFEYTPEDIVASLIENMKNYPVLWEFHDQPFNKKYIKAIEELCRIINTKWSLNISTLKMKRSLNRIFRFYRFMLPSESIDEFENYFDKCAIFLPSSAEAIPRARCPYCCICYKKDSDLRKHIVIQHKSLKWPYKCQQCLERFRDCDAYELHKRLPHYQEVFKCDHCQKRFSRRHLLNKHVASYEKTIEKRLEAAKPIILYPSFPCDGCRRTFRTIEDLNRHKTCHIRGKIKCHLCTKEFALKSGLNLHLKRHRKQYDFVCEVCGKGFILKSYLNEHMLKHTGTKVTCNICNLKLRKCSLQRHLRLVHIAEVGTIESTFRAKSHRYTKFIRPRQSFKRSRAEEGPRNYGCKRCKINFDRLKNLKDHNKLVHFDVKKTTCQLCPVEFKHQHNLKRHYREKHKLHTYQIFRLVDQKDDLNIVMSMSAEEMESIMPEHFVITAQNERNDSKRDISRSDELQDEIMKAVENLDNQDIKVDDDHSMHDFFTDLLKQ